MSDLVERLQNADTEELHGYAAVELGQLLGEAADEIARLQAVVDAAREVLADHDELEATFPGQSKWHLNKLRVMGLLADAIRALEGEVKP